MRLWMTSSFGGAVRAESDECDDESEGKDDAKRCDGDGEEEA
mgnify:CR=1 FL=1